MRMRFVVCSALAVGLAVSHAHAQDNKDSRVSSPVDGIIQEIAVKARDKVQRGQILAKLDDRLARVEVEIAQAELHAAEAGSAQAEAEFKVAEATLRRTKVLAKTDAFAQSVLGSIEMEAQRAKTRFESQRIKILLPRLNLKKAEIILDMHVLRSPAAGTVRRLTRRPGEGIAARELFAEIDHDDNKK